MRRCALALLFMFAMLALFASAAPASANILSCIPASETENVRAYADGFAKGNVPAALDSFRALVRFGKDEYEFQAEHLRSSAVKDGKFTMHALQPLSAGASAELTIEGRLGKIREPFAATLTLRAENRTGTGALRCTFD